MAGGLGVAAAAYWISSELATGGLDTADQTSSVVAAFAALISLVLAAFPLLSPRSSERTNTSRELLAEQLAEQVRALSVREQEHWRTVDPRPLPVRWRTASEELFDRWENIHGAAEGADHGPVPLAGDFTRILRTYAAVPAQRLIILGRAGAGKTALAQHLILALLAERDRTRPVPVLFSLNSWDASSVRLRDWMIHQLVRNYPFLDELDPTGRSGAEVLVDGGRVLPVLDAFDEIPQRHHREAVGEISRLDGPLVVTTRPGEYAEAVLDKNVIGRAAAIELDDVGLDEAERYLRASTGKTRAAEWAAVFDHLRSAPGDPATRNLAPVLSTPLMTMLARATYNDIPEQHPGELLDIDLLPTREAVEQHLLGAFLHASYDPRRGTGRNEAVQAKWAPERARHWLGHLATHLIGRDTHDLTWWQLPVTLPRPIRILVTTTTAGLAVVVIALPLGFVAELLYGFPVGLAVGFTVGVLNEKGSRVREPERLRLRMRRDARRSSARSKKAASELATGFAFGVPIGIVDGLISGLTAKTGLGFVSGVGYGIVFAVSFGITNIAVSALGGNQDPRDAVHPWQLLTTDRTVTLVRAMTAALAVTTSICAAMLAVGYWDGPALLFSGFIGAVVRLGLSSWGSWMLFARLWLPLTRRLPWRPKLFLEDAYRRGVLRQVGATYQFRHVRLRNHLARHHQS